MASYKPPVDQRKTNRLVAPWASHPSRWNARPAWQAQIRTEPISSTDGTH